MTRPGSRTQTSVTTYDAHGSQQKRDHVATEEPLEIRLVAGSETKTIAITMRTPGADFELALGFLYGEGVIATNDDVRQVTYCVDPEVDPEQQYNIVNVELNAPALPQLPSLERHFYTSSACGVCGKASLEFLHERGVAPLEPGMVVGAEALNGLPARFREAQGLFDSTGGLHASGVFDGQEELVCLREDVGRHNAVDKVVGWALMDRRLPLDDHILMVSGRASYEIVQKALTARIPIVCAVSAPSSLAVSLADEFGMTLVGFLREGRFNVYAGSDRIAAPAGQANSSVAARLSD